MKQDCPRCGVRYRAKKGHSCKGTPKSTPEKGQGRATYTFDSPSDVEMTHMGKISEEESDDRDPMCQSSTSTSCRTA